METHHLQSVRHPYPAARDPACPPHDSPNHIRLPAHEPMPRPTAITSGPHLLHRRLGRVRPHTHHRGSQPATNAQRGTLPHGPPHGSHYLRGLLAQGTGAHGGCHHRNHDYPARLPPARRPHLRTVQVPGQQTKSSSSTYPPSRNSIRPRTGYQRKPPIPHTTKQTTTPTESNRSPKYSETRTAEHTSNSSRRH